MHQIKIGTLVNGREAETYIPQIIPYGFESFSLTFGKSVEGINLPELGKKIKSITDKNNKIISTVSIYGNPLIDTPEGKITLQGWKDLIINAHHFGTNIITGFTGRIIDQPIPDSIPRFKEVFGELTKLAKDKNIKLAFENCDMGGNWEKGNWNIAHYPAAWELMFDAVPEDNIGLEWEPCHQMIKLIDHMAQLRKWAPKIFHIHGKDATIEWDVLREFGTTGPKWFGWHRTPGFGDANWTDIISVLRKNNYTGTIDIEGWHDPVYKDELEMTGQVHALNYLKQCRGGDFIPNPS